MSITTITLPPKYRATLYVTGTKPRARKIDRHIVKLGMYELTDEAKMEAVKSGIETLKSYRNVTEANVLLTYTTFEQYEDGVIFSKFLIFDDRTLSFPLPTQNQLAVQEVTP